MIFALRVDFILLNATAHLGYGTIAAISLEYVLSWFVESSAVTT
jgi:hypothetical protein